MAKSSTERQAEYRDRRKAGEVAESRFFCWLSHATLAKLACLATVKRISRKDLITKLIEEARP